MLSEIDERRHFLEDMEAVGKAEKYRSIIETEISQVKSKVPCCTKGIDSLSQKEHIVEPLYI